MPRKRYAPYPACAVGLKVHPMANNAAQFPPLEQITRPTVETASAAHYLNRRPQTLRGWACLENGPIRPVRINGRLAWKVSDLRRVLGVS